MTQYTRNQRYAPNSLTLNKAEIGARITRLREERKWTGTKLAAFVGVSSGTVSRWEAGERIPDRDALVALSLAFGRSIDYILAGVSRRGTLRTIVARQRAARV